MRDRALAMKWVESLAAECGGNSEMILDRLRSSGVSQKTINDQIRRLKKQCLISSAGIAGVCSHESSNEECVEGKPFSPAPKSKVVKKKK